MPVSKILSGGRGLTERMALGLLVAALLVSARPRAADAVVLSEDELEETSTEVGMILRAFSFILTGEVLEPPFADSNPTGIGLFDVRGYFARRSPTFKLVAHAQLTSGIRAHALGGSLAFGRGLAPPRWLPLHVHLADDPTISLTGTVDWLYAAWSKGPVTVTVGRQPVTFGRGKLWSPSDLVGTFALTEVDSEYKPGADAVRLDYAPSERMSFTLVASTGEIEAADEAEYDLEAELQGTTALARGKWSFGRGEVGALAGMIRGDAVVGVDIFLDMTSFELYGETTATLITGESLGAPRTESGDVLGKAIVGATFRPNAKITLGPELFYNGFGATESGEYLETISSPRLQIGEQTTMGDLYAGMIVGWQAHALLNLGGAVLSNLRDPSGLASLVANLSLSDNTSAVVGGYLGLGDLPEIDGFDLVIPHEFGLYPKFFFAELKAVF